MYCELEENMLLLIEAYRLSHMHCDTILRSIYNSDTRERHYEIFPYINRIFTSEEHG